MKTADEGGGMSRTAVLVRRQRIEVGDVSRKGCRLESPQPLAIGAVGMLSVTIDGRQHVELFRVSHGGPLRDSENLFEAGVEFLPMPAGLPSLHDVAAGLDETRR